jgi:hypothetical protein
MSGGTFSGYVEGLQISRLGKAISLKIRLITPGGQRVELYIHAPPDWLSLGKAISGTYHEAETPDGTVLIIDSVVEDKNLRPAIIHELTVEKILRVDQDTVIVEGKYSDGRMFSHTLRDTRLLELQPRLPIKSLGLFIERDSLQVLVTIINKNEFNLLARAYEFSSQLLKAGLEEPEKKFLEGGQ